MGATLETIEARVRGKYELCEDLFRRGDMAAAVKELYTEDVRYLTGDLRLLHGREQLASFLDGVKAHIAEVHVEIFTTWGDPRSGLVYQLCNTSRKLATGEIAKAHYIATLREISGDWLIAMEVPAMGWVQP